MAKAETSVSSGQFGKAAKFLLPSVADLSGSAAKVYLALCMMCGYHDRHVHISYPSLMKLAGVSRNILAKALNELEALGAIARQSGNVGKCNDYLLPLLPVSESDTGEEDNPYQKVIRGSIKNRDYPVSETDTRTKRSTEEKSIQEAQRAQPHGQAGAALADGAACPNCGSKAVGEGVCETCGWDMGQLALDTGAPLPWAEQARLAEAVVARLTGQQTQPGKEKGREEHRLAMDKGIEKRNGGKDGQ